MILDKILVEKEKEVKILKKCRYSLKEKLKGEKLTLIAEIKKASPSKGLIAKKFAPQEQMKKYILGGADAISILTDRKFFQGSNDIFYKLREHAELPLLRKEFIIDPLQIYESLFLGADVVLLIVAILSQKKLNQLLKICRELNLEAIVEVHNCKELDKALTAEADIIGINNRNLHNFSVDLRTSEKIISELNSKNYSRNYHLISESGIKEKSDIDYLKQLGVDGVLIGETIMKTENTVKKIRELGF